MKRLKLTLLVTCTLSAALGCGTASAADEVFLGDKNSGCKVYKPNTKANESVTWSGKCVNGFADGSGTAQWFSDGKPSVTFAGTFQGGRLQGRGVMTASGGDRYEGDYRDGKREGRGVYRIANGDRYEGEYKNNLRHGKGVLVDASGRRSEVEHRDGQAIAQSSAANAGATTAASGGQSSQITTAPSGVSAQPFGAASSQPPATQAKSDKAVEQIGQETKTASGATLRIDSCGGNPIVMGMVPKTIDLKTTTPTAGYNDADAIGGIFPIVKEAVALLAGNCNLNRNNLPTIYLFVDRLPPPGKIDGLHIMLKRFFGSWNVVNGPADRHKWEEEQRQQQAATQRYAAAEQAAEADNKKKKEAYFKKHAVNSFADVDALADNPFAFEGKRILLVVAYNGMESATAANLKAVGGWSLPNLLATEVPRGTFVTDADVYVFVGKVLDTQKSQSGVRVTRVQFVAAQKCNRTRSGSTDHCF